MSKDVRHYDVIVAPVITEKATIASESNKVVFKVAQERDQAADQGGGREVSSTSRSTAVNTLVRKGKDKVFRGVRGRQSDVKKAIVTLAEGHKIDVTTGL